MLSRVLIIAWLWSAAVSAEQTVLEIIPLKYRSVEDVLPVLQPFIGEDGSLAGMSGQLIVRATPRKLAQIREILGKIDTLPKRLRILLKQDESTEAKEQGAEISGQVRAGDARVTIPSHGSGGATADVNGVRARVWRSSSSGRDDATQEVQALEGRPAFVRLGQSVPVPEGTVIREGYRTRIVESTSYQDVGTGFYVLPRLNGDRVVMEISPQKERLTGDHGQNIESQKLFTTVSGRLGEWIELGGLSQDKDNSQSGWVRGAQQTRHDLRRVWVKVEALP